MKRSLPFIPMIFLALLNACDVGPIISDQEGTAVAHTQTAAVWTPIPTQTYNPNVPDMISTLNADLSIVNPLEWNLDAEYHVSNVTFLNVPDSLALIFRVDVRCECINGDECCFPERTFVVIMEAMKRNGTTLPTQVPGEVSEIIVVCYNHKTPVAAVSAPWQEAKAYLQGYLTGFQLAPRVVRTAIP